MSWLTLLWTTLPSNMPENKSPNLWTQSARTKGGWSTPATAAMVTHHLHPPRTVSTAPDSSQLAEQTVQHVIPVVPNVKKGTLGTKMLWWQATPTKECTPTWVTAEEVQMPTSEPQHPPRAEQQDRHHRCQWGPQPSKWYSPTLHPTQHNSQTHPSKRDNGWRCPCPTM